MGAGLIKTLLLCGDSSVLTAFTFVSSLGSATGRAYCRGARPCPSLGFFFLFNTLRLLLINSKVGRKKTPSEAQGGASAWSGSSNQELKRTPHQGSGQSLRVDRIPVPSFFRLPPSYAFPLITHDCRPGLVAACVEKGIQSVGKVR